MQKNLLIGLVAIVVLGGGVYLATNKPCEGASCELGKPVTVLEESSSVSSDVQENTSEEVAVPAPTPSSETSSAPSSTGAVVEENEPSPVPAPAPSAPVAVAGSYEAYTPDKIARAENGDVVLFFHAGWCPSCRGLNADIEASRGDIPDGLTILKLNYDTETALKKKYGVTTQHTLVQVDKDGNLIKKWSGGGTLETIVSQVK